MLIFFLTYLFALVVHELGHFMSFVVDGVKMRALFLTVLLFIKENDRWTLKFRPNKLTAIGGMAVPDLDVIQDAADFSRLQKVYAKAIIAGPAASITLWLISIIVIVAFVVGVAGDRDIAGLLIYIGSLTVITLLIVVSSLFQSEALVGDFPAYKLCKEDRFFAAMQLYQYAMLSSNPTQVRKNNIYLKHIILEELDKKLKQRDTHVFTLNMVDALLVEYLAGESEELPPVISAYVAFLLQYPQRLDRLSNSEIALLLRFHIIRLLFTEEDTKEQARGLFKKLRSELDPLNPIKEYLIKQAEHMLGLVDHRQYLQNKENIRVSIAHDILKNFPGYFIDEVKLNEIAV